MQLLPQECAVLRKSLCCFFLLIAAFVVLPVRSRAQAATEQVLYSFCSQANCTDGTMPSAALIQAADGNFYGVTFTTGYAHGTVFRLAMTGELTTLYTFTGGSDGAGPESQLTQGTDGNLYGVAGNGGNSVNCPADQGCGTIFRLTPAGDLSTLYSFCNAPNSVYNCPDGNAPYGHLIQGIDGNFYGTTAQGGIEGGCGSGGLGLGCGTIFKVTPSGTLTTLYTFAGEGDGALPQGLIQGSDGNFYGTAGINGSGGYGTIFRLTSDGYFSTIFTFPESGLDGGNPFSRLVEFSDGSFYGSTIQAGNLNDCLITGGNIPGCGTLFKVTPSGEFTLLHTFLGAADGAIPLGEMTLSSDGNFYGVTEREGDSAVCTEFVPPGCGTVFEITPVGGLSELYTFQGVPDGSLPIAGLLQGDDGNFYGTTSQGGTGAQQGETAIKVSLTPSLAAPVQLSLSDNPITLGGQVTLSWAVSNAFSTTMQQCYAFVQNSATGAGAWTGLQTGALSSGVYSGSADLTPTAVGSYTYALTCGGVESGFATLVVNAAPTLSITTSSLPGGTVGTLYSATLTATGGIQPYTWSIASGSLPAGLTLDASSGVISGTPTQSGTTSFVAEVRDSENPAMSATANLGIVIAPGTPMLSISPTTVTVSSPGGSGSATLTVTAFSSNSLTFSCSGLPSGAACVFGSLQGSGASGTATLQITATPPSSSRLSPSKMSRPPALLALALPGVIALFGLMTSRRRRPGLTKMFGFALFACVACTLAGCGGGGSSSPGTPTGTSHVVVTATAGSQSATANLTFVVQ